MADTARLSLTISAGCFLAAGFSCLLNQFATDTACAAGLAIVACFYLVIGVVDLVRVQRSESSRQLKNSNEQTSRNQI